MNLGLRWEFATPLWERDNHWSNFDPATNTLVRATNGSLYNRALVNPDYKDFGPRLGLAYSVDAEDCDPRADTASAIDSSTGRAARRKGSTAAGDIRIVNQSIHAGRPVPSGFLTTQNGFHHRHRQPPSIRSPPTTTIFPRIRVGR